MAKVFISHKSQDAVIAKSIYDRLAYNHGIEAYLDVIDAALLKPGEDIAVHIQNEMGKCTQLLAVVSQATQGSWWVPWEIGIASEKDFPLATFVSGSADIPDYLKKWPYLRTTVDVDRYAAASKSADTNFVVQKRVLNEGVARFRSTRQFYTDLKKSLGQA